MRTSTVGFAELKINNMTTSQASISVVIPVYNAANRISKVTSEIIASLEQLETQYEIVLVEDCGGDNSWQVIKELSSQHSSVRGIKLSRNYGQHNALLCGIRASNNDVIVTMDDDGQNPSNQIEILVNGLNSGCDVVYGTPKSESHSKFRNIASITTKKVIKHLMGVSSATQVSAFRAFKSSLRSAFDDYSGPTVNIDIMLTWATASFSNVDVDRPARNDGASGYTLTGLINHAFNMITGFSGLPLRIASYFGMLFAFFGFAILIYILANYAINGSVVPGFAFLASLITIFSGVQLLTIGVIGEYIARIHFNSMDKPAYITKEECGKQPQNSAH